MGFVAHTRELFVHGIELNKATVNLLAELGLEFSYSRFLKNLVCVFFTRLYCLSLII